MGIYTVYLEIFGKKMKTKIYADSIADAEQKVKDKIKFHKITPPTTTNFDDIMDMFGDVFKSE